MRPRALACSGAASPPCALPAPPLQSRCLRRAPPAEPRCSRRQCVPARRLARPPPARCPVDGCPCAERHAARDRDRPLLLPPAPRVRLRSCPCPRAALRRALRKLKGRQKNTISYLISFLFENWF
ncbi:Protein of unknown function [Gryllus bimaculatus]|nr:Protein of unknown function [Gryllus bimaculatus]